MSNNNWRLSGGLGIDPDPIDPNQEVMTQGLGMPLRPIDNVPFDNSPPISNDLVAEGLFMQWSGNWSEGKYYPKGSFVRDGEFTCVANKITLEKPAPVPDPADPETYGLPAYAPADLNNVSTVVSRNSVVFSQSGWVKELRVWVTEVTANTNYRIITVNRTDPDALTTNTIDNPILTAGTWSTIGFSNTIISAGDSYDFIVEALNSGADTNISGGWRYQGPTQGVAPLAQNWTQDNQRTSFRIDKFDLDGTDRSTELEGVIIDSTIGVVETDNVANSVAYRVTTVTDSVTYMTFGVVLQSETGVITTGAVCTLDIDVPIPLPTHYAQEVSGLVPLPSWATSAEGALSFDGVDQGVPVTNAYGVDILFEPASISEDWDIITTP